MNKSEYLLGRRVLATIIDYNVVAILSIFFSFIYLIFSGTFKFEIPLINIILPLLFWFLIIVLIEFKYGRTLGKRIAGIRVVSLSTEEKPTLIQVLKRRILDPIDIFMLGIVSLFVISNSTNNQRFGDKFANTQVVKKN